MKLSEYIKNLNEALEKHGDHEVVYSRDDEGNGFQSVHHAPSPGFYKDGEFFGEDDFVYEEDLKINSICIN